MRVNVQASLKPLSGVISGKIVLYPEGKEVKKLSFIVTDPLGCNLHLQISDYHGCVLEMRGEPTKEIIEGLLLGQRTLFFATLDPVLIVCQRIERQYNSTTQTKQRYDDVAIIMKKNNGYLASEAEQGGTWHDTPEHIEALLNMLEQQPVS